MNEQTYEKQVAFTNDGLNKNAAQTRLNFLLREFDRQLNVWETVGYSLRDNRGQLLKQWIREYFESQIKLMAQNPSHGDVLPFILVFPYASFNWAGIVKNILKNDNVDEKIDPRVEEMRQKNKGPLRPYLLCGVSRGSCTATEIMKNFAQKINSWRKTEKNRFVTLNELVCILAYSQLGYYTLDVGKYGIFAGSANTDPNIFGIARAVPGLVKIGGLMSAGMDKTIIWDIIDPKQFPNYDVIAPYFSGKVLMPKM